MRKLISTLTILLVFSIAATPAFSTTTFNKYSISDEGKKKEITIGSSRSSGDMEVRFKSDKTGTAAITVLNEAGTTVLQQTNTLTTALNTIPLKGATALGEGTYTVSLTVNNKTFSTTMMIWK